MTNRSRLRRRYGRAAARELTGLQRTAAREGIRAAAQQALRDGSNWQANAIWRLRAAGFSTALAQEIVADAEKRFRR